MPIRLCNVSHNHNDSIGPTCSSYNHNDSLPVFHCHNGRIL